MLYLAGAGLLWHLLVAGDLDALESRRRMKLITPPIASVP